MGGGEQRGLSVLLNFSCSFRLSLTYIQYQSVSESRISVLSPSVGLFVRIFVVQASFLHVHIKGTIISVVPEADASPGISRVRHLEDKKCESFSNIEALPQVAWERPCAQPS